MFDSIKPKSKKWSEQELRVKVAVVISIVASGLVLLFSWYHH